jgi:hypothetical protein
MKSAQETPPARKATANHKWKKSRRTLDLVEERKKNWDKLSNDEQKQKSHSARDDYRDYFSNILEDIKDVVVK